MLEACRERLVGHALNGLADRSGDVDAAKQLLLRAEFAQPFVVGGGERLPCDEAGAGIGDVEARELIGLVASRGATVVTNGWNAALLDHVVAALQRQRILIAGNGYRFAERSAEFGLIRARIDELGKRFNIREIAINRWNATQLGTQFEGDGFEMIALGQATPA